MPVAQADVDRLDAAEGNPLDGIVLHLNEPRQAYLVTANGDRLGDEYDITIPAGLTEQTAHREFTGLRGYLHRHPPTRSADELWAELDDGTLDDVDLDEAMDRNAGNAIAHYFEPS